jgi:hypothetical protein
VNSGYRKPENPKSRSPEIFEGHKNCRGFNCWILVDKNPEKKNEVPKILQSRQSSENLVKSNVSHSRWFMIIVILLKV